MTTGRSAHLKELLTSRDWTGDYMAEHVELDNTETVFSSDSSIWQQEEPDLLTEHETTNKQMAPRKSFDALNFLSEIPDIPKPGEATVLPSTANTAKGTDWDREYNRIFDSCHADDEELAQQAGITNVPLAGGCFLRHPSVDMSAFSMKFFDFSGEKADGPRSIDMLRSLMGSSLDEKGLVYRDNDDDDDEDDEEENSNHTPIPVSVGGAPVPSLPTSMDLSVFLPSLPFGAISTERHETVPLEPPVESVTVPRAAQAPPKTTKKEATTTTTKKRKKKKKPRKKEPRVKIYVEPTDLDVLSGRGGRSNHHPGNKRYLEEVLNRQKVYKASSKVDKTDVSQRLVDFVHSYGGRFLELEQATKQWYIVLNIVARRKASQALREHMSREEREEKKAQQTVQQEG